MYATDAWQLKRDVHNGVNVNIQYLDSTFLLKMSLNVAQNVKMSPEVAVPAFWKVLLDSF